MLNQFVNIKHLEAIIEQLTAPSWTNKPNGIYQNGKITHFIATWILSPHLQIR